MGRVRDRLDHTTFRCGCGRLFEAAPGRIEDCADTPWHPWEYFAPCPACGDEAPQQAQARHLLKMWAKATGPRTAEGKAAVTRNLEGHPTPEEAVRTRFNAMKHGLNAEVATYFPAKPGRYPHCNGCPYYANCLPGDACQKRTELFLRHRIAFETRDPSILGDLRADLHATVSAILQDMMMAVLQDGARIKTPAWYYDKDGGFHLARFDANGRHAELEDDEEAALAGFKNVTQLYEIKEHPLLKRIGDWIKGLGLDLNSQGMTPRVQDEEEAIRGHLSQTAEDREVSLEYQRRNAEALEGLKSMFERAAVAKQRDPVLLEHKRGVGADEA